MLGKVKAKGHEFHDSSFVQVGGNCALCGIETKGMGGENSGGYLWLPGSS